MGINEVCCYKSDVADGEVVVGVCGGGIFIGEADDVLLGIVCVQRIMVVTKRDVADSTWKCWWVSLSGYAAEDAVGRV